MIKQQVNEIKKSSDSERELHTNINIDTGIG